MDEFHGSHKMGFGGAEEKEKKGKKSAGCVCVCVARSARALHFFSFLSSIMISS